MLELLKKYDYAFDKERMSKTLDRISSSLETLVTEKMIKECFSCMDLTSLKIDENPASIQAFIEKVNALPETFPDFPCPASVCVFPNYLSQVRDIKRVPCHITSTSACFPTSQSFLAVKLLECRMSVEAGADEIDIVIPLAEFLSGDYNTARNQLVQIRETIDNAADGKSIVFKVILETGVLCSPELIATAAFIAMEAGADFLKTSTGKVPVNATPSSAYIICECIRNYYEKTGRRVGFKAAGGISTTLDAVSYYLIVSTLLGKEWLCPELFRLGVSRLANSLISSVNGKNVKYF